jgi:hypothetical protein
MLVKLLLLLLLLLLVPLSLRVFYSSLEMRSRQRSCLDANTPSAAARPKEKGPVLYRVCDWVANESPRDLFYLGIIFFLRRAKKGFLPRGNVWTGFASLASAGPHAQRERERLRL